MDLTRDMCVSGEIVYSYCVEVSLPLSLNAHTNLCFSFFNALLYMFLVPVVYLYMCTINMIIMK